MQPFDLDLEPRIVHEDAHVLAVYKPPRLHCAPLGRGGADLATWLFERRPKAAFDATSLRGKPGEGGLFHRLDFETSGLVLFALDLESLASLLRAQDAGLVEKAYRAFARPSLAGMPGARPASSCPEGLDLSAWASCLAGCRDAGGSLDAAGAAGIAGLAQGGSIESRFRPYGPGGSRVACLGPGEEPSGGGRRLHGTPETRYRTELDAICASAVATGLVLDLEARIHRGFRHQIRAHLAWIGLPLLGDPLYGGEAWPRLCLHARRLSFPHPKDGVTFTIECS